MSKRERCYVWHNVFRAQKYTHKSNNRRRAITSIIEEGEDSQWFSIGQITWVGNESRHFEKHIIDLYNNKSS